MQDPDVFAGFTVIGIIICLVGLSVMWLIFPFILLSKLTNMTWEIIRQFAECFKRMDAAQVQAEQAIEQLSAIVEASYVTVKCGECGSEVRFPAHCRGHTHPCPQCQAEIAME
jgi:hypothetical protein